MPSRREVRKRLPEAYRRAAAPVQEDLYAEYVGAIVLDPAYKASLEQIAKSLEEKAERLARSRGCNERS